MNDISAVALAQRDLQLKLDDWILSNPLVKKHKEFQALSEELARFVSRKYYRDRRYELRKGGRLHDGEIEAELERVDDFICHEGHTGRGEPCNEGECSEEETRNTRLTRWGQDTPKAPITIPDNINLVTEKPLQLDLTNWLYASDFHCPMHNRLFTERLVAVGRAQGITDLIIGGDTFDFASLSHFPRTERQAATEDVMGVAGSLLLKLAEYFNLYILPGNHDARHATKINDFMRFSRLVYAALEGRQPPHKITVTGYDYIYVGPQETGWVVGHPRFFSTIPGRGVAEVTLLERRNVIGAHNHIIGMQQSKDGRFFGFDPGHMTEPEMTPYYMQSNGLSKYPRWKAGFMLIKNNIPRCMSDRLVDWAEYGTV